MITINHKSNIYEQLYTQIKNQILVGERKKDEKLPATRFLAKEYGISRNSVVAAYDQLCVEGYIRSVIGSGYYVENVEKPFQIKDKVTTTSKLAEKPPCEPKYNFRYGNLEYNCYQNRQWRKCMINAMDSLANDASINYLCPEGLPELRQELADFLLKSRGVKCDPAQIIITNGHQAAIDIVSSLFAADEWAFAMEEPGYDGCRVVMERHGFHPLPIPVEQDGISISMLQGLSKALVYVTPSHQFPLGSILPIGKRYELIEWARQSGSYLIEDDYDSELRYNSHPIQALQSLDEHDRVIYIGTFSKALSPDLRIAYLILPNALWGKYKERYLVANSPIPTLLQKTLAEYLRIGEYERNLRAVRTFYKKKHDFIVSRLERPGIELLGTEAGLHFIMKLDTQMPQERIIEEMKKREIGVYPTKRYWITKDQCPSNQVLVGFSAIPTDKLEKAMAAMNQVLDEIMDVKQQ